MKPSQSKVVKVLLDDSMRGEVEAVAVANGLTLAEVIRLAVSRHLPSLRNRSLLSPAVTEAREALKTKGWSYRKAASHLDVCLPHLCRVLNGRRESASLLERISQLPPRSASR